MLSLRTYLYLIEYQPDLIIHSSICGDQGGYHSVVVSTICSGEISPVVSIMPSSVSVFGEHVAGDGLDPNAVY